MSRHRGDAWTAEQVMRLEELIEQGLTYSAIAYRMRRSVTAINIARKRHGIRARTKATLTARHIAALFGFSDGRTAQAWIRAGWLNGHQGAGLRSAWVATLDDVVAFMEDRAHWHRWEAEHVTDSALREWALELRAGDAWLTTGEVARRLHVSHATVNQWIHKGIIRASRHANWMVRASDLDGFVVPADRPRGNIAMRRFGAEEDRLLLGRRAAGGTWWEIARELGRNASSVQGRYKRLAAHAAGEREEVAA